MANIKKSFNFRNGVQVDDDNFIVNPNGLVGIGSTVPTESLDVLGNVRIRGSLLVDNIQADSIVNTSETGSVSFNLVNVGITSITSGIVSATSGIVTYYGDATYLQGMPTSQWVDVDPGLGYTSIYAAGNVGIATTYPFYTFQVGIATGGVGITSEGDVIIGRDLYVSGITTVNTSLNVTGITTSYSFSGFGTNITGINASNISNGTLDDARIPSNINKASGIATFSEFYGNLIGIATTARNLTTDANIDIVSIVSDYSNLGIATVSTLNATTSIGIGTNNPNTDLHVRKEGSDAEIQITSDTTAKLIIGQDITLTSNNTIIQFNDTSGSVHPESGENCFDIINYAPGNFNNFIRPDSTPNLKFNWINDSTNAILMSLTSGGNLGIGTTNPEETFKVVGTSTITDNSFVGGDFSVTGGVTGGSLSISGSSSLKSTIIIGSVGIFANSPNYTLQVGDDLNALGIGTGVGINSSGNIIATGIVTASKFVGIGSDITLLTPENISSGTITNVSINASSGVVTTGTLSATYVSGIGSNITLLSPENISSGTISDVNIYSVSGVITASQFIGDGSSLTSLTPENISSGTISDVNINSVAGIVTALEFVGSASSLTSLTPENISSGTITNVSIDSVGGIITASQFVGSGSSLTSLIPENINSGTISNVNINSVAGIVTALEFVGSGSSLTSLKPENVDSGSFNGSSHFFPNSPIGILTTNVENADLKIRNNGIICGVNTFDASPGFTTFIDQISSSTMKMSEYSIHFEYPDYIQTENIILTYNENVGSLHTTFASISSPSKIVSIGSTLESGTVRLEVTPNAGISGIVTYRYYQRILYS